MSVSTTSGISPSPQARHKWKPLTGLMVRPSEVAALRLNGKPGVEGNELILRSGVVIPLAHQEARELKHEIVAVCGLSEESAPDELIFVRFD